MPLNFDFEAIKFMDGSLTAVMVDEDGDPNRVIENTEKSYIEVKWWLKTSDPWILNNTTFHLSATAELIGSGEVTPLATLDVPVTTPVVSWAVQMPITPSTPPIPDGAYHIVVLLTHTAPYPTGDKLTRLAGFAELPIVQFYTHEA